MLPGQKPNPVIVILDKNGSEVVQLYLVTNFQLTYSADIHISNCATQSAAIRKNTGECERLHSTSGREMRDAA
jgi:hypothetical protein